MLSKLWNRIKLIDKWILIPFILLTLTSIVMVYSASSFVAMEEYNNAEHYLIRQVIFVTGSYIVMLIVYNLSEKVVKRRGLIVGSLLITVGSLVYVLVLGDTINGAKRWISLPFMSIQPAEIAKVVVVWYLAYILSRRQKNIGRNFWKQMISPLIMIGGIMFLILVQPDTGTPVIILVIVMAMMFASGVSWKIGLLGGAASGGLIAFVLFIIRRFGSSLPFLGYRYDRFVAFWDPFSVSQGPGLQLVNSYYALSRGGLFGVGIGGSVQKTGYLPFPYTDFIMAIVGEELGLFGVLLILGLVFVIIYRMFMLGIKSKKPFNAILCIGMGTMLLIQTFFNIGGLIGLLPITGLTFPFMSYGGSSLMILTFGVALVLNVASKEKLENRLEHVSE